MSQQQPSLSLLDVLDELLDDHIAKESAYRAELERRTDAYKTKLAEYKQALAEKRRKAKGKQKKRKEPYRVAYRAAAMWILQDPEGRNLDVPIKKTSFQDAIQTLIGKYLLRVVADSGDCGIDIDGGNPAEEQVRAWLLNRRRGALTGTTPLEAELRRLDTPVVVQSVLRELWNKYPGECEDMGLPPPAKPGEGEGDGGAGALDETTSLPEAGRFIFAPDGDGYCIAGFGERGHVPSLKGFDVIARLVRTPSVPVPMLELAGAADDERIACDHRSRQETLDSQALKEIHEKLAELRADYEKARAANNTVEMASAEKQIEQLKSNLREATGLAGGSRDMNSEKERLRPTIHRNLNTAYTRLRNAKPPMDELANHFEGAISSEGGAFIYCPAAPIVWSPSLPPKM
jgi:hypothetical protein